MYSIRPSLIEDIMPFEDYSGCWLVKSMWYDTPLLLCNMQRLSESAMLLKKICLFAYQPFQACSGWNAYTSHVVKMWQLFLTSFDKGPTDKRFLLNHLLLNPWSSLFCSSIAHPCQILHDKLAGLSLTSTTFPTDLHCNIALLHDKCICRPNGLHSWGRTRPAWAA